MVPWELANLEEGDLVACSAILDMPLPDVSVGLRRSLKDYGPALYDLGDIASLIPKVPHLVFPCFAVEVKGGTGCMDAETYTCRHRARRSRLEDTQAMLNAAYLAGRQEFEKSSGRAGWTNKILSLWFFWRDASNGTAAQRGRQRPRLTILCDASEAPLQDAYPFHHVEATPIGDVEFVGPRGLRLIRQTRAQKADLPTITKALKAVEGLGGRGNLNKQANCCGECSVVMDWTGFSFFGSFVSLDARESCTSLEPPSLETTKYPNTQGANL
ncbi:uncharacterized protein N7515_008262 [Penicillium bovifimosum]|uniref:Uncharacterized protein n=1 Tax=Penicillium bovifimosum TaxID=126998 RepID=A0A9W9KXB9_9EURO|nr:uncharacterized protein N7515_008262 [Penicillium bovifimosum]KAJ5124437.1 hypothetical protein N7515_008262 [Penicillium bovifimosum]